jgi:hypothetical protein
MRIVEEDGKRYEIDDNGMVVSASTVQVDDEAQDEPVKQPLALNDRVEVEGRLGKVVTRAVPTVYGPTVGVQFDDGEIGEYLEEHVATSEEEAIRYDKPIDQVRADWEEYNKLPDFTAEEVDTKARLARTINITAKALVTDQRTSLSDQVVLDQMVLATGTDLYDLKAKQERLTLEGGEDWLNKQPNYRLPEEIINSTSRSSEDVSWLLVAADDAAQESSEFDWDQHLSNEALRATSRLETEQLESDEFMQAVLSYREDAMPVGYDTAKKEQFAAMLSSARQAALAERSAQATAKVAAVQEELEDFDPSRLYL